MSEAPISSGLSDLKACFEEVGCTEVVTYIQSGNVVFRSERTKSAQLVSHLQSALSARFNYQAQLVLLTAKQLAEVVASAPARFGQKPDQYRYDVLFLQPSLSSGEAIKQISAKAGVDTAHAGKGVLYFSRLIARASQSHLSRITRLPVYQQLTIRNWNTTTKLLALMEQE